MDFLELIDLNRIRRAISYLLLGFLALWLQTAVFSRLLLTGIRPFFVPVLPVAVGLWEGGLWGGFYGMALGLFCDIGYTDSNVQYMVLFTLLGFFAGLLGEFFINRRFFAYFLLSALALTANAAMQTIPVWVFRDAPLEELIPVAAAQFFLSLPFAVPVYFSMKAVYRAT